MTVIARRLGGSIAVVIPRTLAREMDWSAGTALEITAGGAQLVLRKRGQRPRRPLRQIVAQIKPASYRHHRHEFAEDRPVGREVW